MADPITAHGWIIHRPRYGGASLVTDDGHFRAFVASTPTFDGTQGPAAAADALVRCIEDAATLAKVRDLVTEWGNSEDDYIADADHDALVDLLTLLSGDGTP